MIRETPRRPDLFLLHCDIELDSFLSLNLSYYYRFNILHTSPSWFSYVIVADRDVISTDEWSEFIDFRYSQKHETGWLILLDEEHYELPLDKHVYRAKTHHEVLGILFELYNKWSA